MFKTSLTRTAHRIWHSTGWISALLLPLSCAVQLFITRKKWWYRQHPERIWQSPVPVVIVGNIYVGGTGKTPVVMELIEQLRQRGWIPGVISRGYGVKIGEHARVGQGELDPARFGDEPALIARTTQAAVAVHPSRPKAAQALLSEFPDINVIVADDGLQHLALGRDAEIIVQDDRGIGNGRLLPAGPLREPASKLSEVDIIVTNESSQPPGFTGPEPTPVPEDAPLSTKGNETEHSYPARRSGKPVHVIMRLVPHEVIHVNTGRRLPWSTWLATHRNADISAVAAIGNPERFFSMLRNEGLSLSQTLALPDHTDYDDTSFTTIGAATILITTKDAVKCAKLHETRLWAVSVAPQFSDERWLDKLHNMLTNSTQRKST